LAGGGSVCFRFQKPTEDSSFHMSVSFEPARAQAQVLWKLDGGNFRFGPLVDGPVTKLEWGMSSRIFNGEGVHTLRLTLPQAATSLKLQAVVFSPTAGNETDAVERCK